MGGRWMFAVSAFYIESLVTFYNCKMWIAVSQFVWIIVLCLPTFVSPLARFLSLEPLWKWHK